MAHLIKGRVLCVEGNKDVCEMLTALLELAGFKVVSADSITQVLNLVKSDQFDLYILNDSIMDGNSVELCKKIRSFDQNTPVLFYSSSARFADKEAAIGAGAQAFVAKPDYHNELEPTIFRLIDQTRSI